MPPPSVIQLWKLPMAKFEDFRHWMKRWMYFLASHLPNPQLGNFDLKWKIDGKLNNLSIFVLKKPKPIQNWNDILQADESKNGCYSHASPDWLNSFLQSGTPSEDCLYLNIFSPHQKVGTNILIINNSLLFLAKSPYPVLFIIHGGGYEMGSALSFANFTDIGTNFVQYGIVVVSFQYRLGQLGWPLNSFDWIYFIIRICHHRRWCFARQFGSFWPKCGIGMGQNEYWLFWGKSKSNNTNWPISRVSQCQRPRIVAI